ncbi:MAG: Ig-like domain-containing protein [Clostridia bacterium]|nr:Ig-like domain-containing protein [Clostridia bacterium]
MKKLWCLVALLPLCLAILLCGCGETSDNPGDKTDDNDPPTTTASVTLEFDELTVTEGETAQVKVTAVDCTSVSWKVENEEIATVETKNFVATVTGVSVGSTVITVTGKDADGVEVKDTCTVTVEAKDTRLSVFLPAGKLVLTREKSASVKAIAAEGLTGEVTWESSDEEIGTVDYQGLLAIVTAHKKGTCTITVHCGTASASFELICGLT